MGERRHANSVLLYAQLKKLDGLFVGAASNYSLRDPFTGQKAKDIEKCGYQ